jgi:hypothetical protein
MFMFLTVRFRAFGPSSPSSAGASFRQLLLQDDDIPGPGGHQPCFIDHTNQSTRHAGEISSVRFIDIVSLDETGCGC